MTVLKSLNKCCIIILFAIINSVISSSTFALSFVSLSNSSAKENFHPVISLSAGSAFASQVGKTQYFPIQNPLTDQFYNYYVNSSEQAASLIDGFIGNEFHLPRRFLFQVGLDYSQTSSFSASGTVVQGLDIGSENSYRFHYSVITRQLLFEGKLLSTFKAYIHPYILAGLGASFNSTNNFYTNVPPFLTFTKVYAPNRTTSFSYAFGAGADVDVTNNLRLGLGYRFVDLGRIQTGSATIAGTNISGRLNQTNLYSNQLLAQLSLIL